MTDNGLNVEEIENLRRVINNTLMTHNLPPVRRDDEERMWLDEDAITELINDLLISDEEENMTDQPRTEENMTDQPITTEQAANPTVNAAERVTWKFIPKYGDDSRILTRENIPFQGFPNSLYVCEEDIPRIESLLKCRFIFRNSMDTRRINFMSDDVDDRVKEAIVETVSNFPRSWPVQTFIFRNEGFINNPTPGITMFINLMKIPENQSLSIPQYTIDRSPVPSTKYRFSNLTPPSNNLVLKDRSPNGVTLASIAPSCGNIMFERDSVTVRYLRTLKKVINKVRGISVNNLHFLEHNTINQYTDATDNQYATVYDESRQRILSGLNTRVRDLRSRVDQWTEQIRQDCQELNSAQIELMAVTNHQTSVEKAARDLELMRNHPKIAKVSIRDNNTLIIITEPITIENIPIGRFLISMSPSNGSILVKNLTKRLNYGGFQWDHPHIHSSRPCWGNIGPTLQRAIAEYDLPIATNLIIDYLESVNERDTYGRNFNKWVEHHERNRDQTNSSLVI